MTRCATRPSSRLARPLAAALAAAALGAALAGCSDDGGGAAAPAPTTSPTTTSSGTPASSAPAAEPAELVADPAASSVSCADRTARRQVVSLWDPTATASGSVRIVRAQAVGISVRLVGAEGVLVTAPASSGPGVAIDNIWPIRPSETLRRTTDLSTRQDLRGMRLSDGQRVLPLFAVRVGPGSVLDGLRITYADDTGRTSDVTLPVGTRFAGGGCPRI